VREGDGAELIWPPASAPADAGDPILFFWQSRLNLKKSHQGCVQLDSALCFSAADG
jgi:hypothetical protein